MSDLFKSDPKKNTVILKNRMQLLKSNSKNLTANMQGLERKNHQLGALLKRVDEIVQNGHKGAVHWNNQLKSCKDRILKRSKKHINDLKKKEILALIKNCDDKMETLSHLTNQVLNHVAHERTQQDTRKNEVEKLKESLNEFVDSTVEEVNNITKEVRIWRFTRQNKRKSEDDKVKEEPAFIKSEPNGDQPVLITSLFKLYPNTNTEPPKKTTGKRIKLEKKK